MRISNERRVAELKDMQRKILATEQEGDARDIRLAIIQEQIDLLVELDKHPLSINRLIDHLRSTRPVQQVSRQTRLL
jgi:hypothetical protein